MLVTARDGSVDDAAVTEAATEFTEKLAADPAVIEAALVLDAVEGATR